MSLKKILLVDDKALLRDALIEYLGTGDYEIIEAEDGEKAVSMFRDNDYDVVILDHNLPGMDGYKTLKLMKQLKPDIPIIGLTGELSIEIREKYLSMGAYDIHAKSAIYEKLIPTLTAALQGEKRGESDEKPDYIQLAEKLKNEGRWEESALYLKEAGIEQRARGKLEKANELFEESINRYIRAGRRSKAAEIEKMIGNG
ncbi:MAG TPA: response regulator [Candidatus Marinimicrobia bacterium]|nr:response regulator [Candidatus Neomarinimicrobiota bacterium]